jgi:outer membrane protein OmpA-like peptidoglycan-associated protein
MEAAFGESLGHVRLHRGQTADRLAREQRALAFTVGHHIAFSRDADAPGTPSGDALLAHELAHTRQQSHSSGAATSLAPGTYRNLETEADGVAGQVVRRLYGDEDSARGSLPAGTGRGLSLQRCDPCKGTRPSPTTTTLPAPRPGTKTLSHGDMTWTLTPAGQSSLHAHIEFTPNAATRASARTITFVQTVRATRQGNPILPSDPAGDKGGGAEYGGPRYVRVDFTAAHEAEPFYGARWDDAAPGGGAFADEPTATQNSGLAGATPGGSRPANTSTASAIVNDTPSLQYFQGEKKEFETVAMVAETGQVLGSLRWGFEYKCQGPNAYQLIGGTVSDCSDGATGEFRPAVDRFFAARFDTIVDSFPAGGSTLTTAQQTQLNPVVARLNANASETVQLGGAADLSESDPVTVSRQRAEAVKAHLVGRGIAASRITIHTYGSTYARVPTAAGAAEPRNRRVQVWVR